MKILLKARRVLMTAAAFTAISAIALSATAADKLTISLSTGPTHLQTTTVVHFAEELKKRSGGDFTYEIFNSGQLYNSRDAGKAVARGDAGMSVLTTPSLSRIEANLNVFDLPMLNGLSMKQRNAMVDGPLGKKLNSLLGERMGVVVPGNWFVLGRVLYWSTSKPLAKLSDFGGLQVRIPGGAANVARLKALGATAVVMPFADTPLALQQGVVDATMGSKETMLRQKMVDTGIKSAYWDEGIVGYLMPIVNKKYWSSLTKKQQALFTEVWNEAVVIERAGVDKGETASQTALEKKGVSFASATADEVAKAREILMPIQAGLVEKLGISAEVMDLAKSAIK